MTNMKWRDRARRGARRAAFLLAIAAACYGAISQQALAAVIQAYIVFEIAASSDESAAEEKLRSTSLANCKQLIVGRHFRVVFVHIRCDERGGDPNYFNQALAKLSAVDGVARATPVSLKQGEG